MYRWSMRHPWLTMVLAGAVTLAAAGGWWRLTLRTDGHALVPLDAPAVARDAEIRERHGLADMIVVMIAANHPDGVFNPRTLALVQRLSRRIAEGVDGRPLSVSSLDTERTDRVYTGTLNFRPFLDPLPTTPEELDRLRADLRAVQLYDGVLVSRDAMHTCILVDQPDWLGREETIAFLHRAVAEQGDVPERIDVIGAPVAESLLGSHVLADLGVPQRWLGNYPAVERDAGASGWPRSVYEWRIALARHLGLVPIALALMAAVFLFVFRSPAAAVLPLMEVGAALVFVFGVMGWVGEPIYLTTTILPIILTAAGVTDEIHIFNRYRRLLRERIGEDHVDVLTATMGELYGPVIKSGVTTAVGFLSFALSPMRPVSTFGLYTALGLLFCLVWSVTVIPAQLRWLGRRGVLPLKARSEDRIAWNSTGDARLQICEGRLVRLARFVLRRRWGVMMMVFVLCAAAPLGIRRLVVQDSWIDGFSPESTFRRSTELFNDQFLGAHLLHLCIETSQAPIAGEIMAQAVDHQQLTFSREVLPDATGLEGWWITLERTGSKEGGVERAARRWTSRIESVTRVDDGWALPFARSAGSPRFVMQLAESDPLAFRLSPRPFLHPQVIARLDALASFVREKENYAVGGVLGYADYVKTANYLVMARKADERRVPDDVTRVERLWTYYRNLRGATRARQAVDDEFGSAIVTVFLRNANFVDTAGLMRDIREYEALHLTPHGLRISFAGDVAVSQTLIDAIVSTQLRSLFGSIIGTFLVMTLFGRTIGWGLYSVIPCAFAVMMNTALMGWLGWPLGVATSMFAAMTVGIGDDFAIHLLERCRLARRSGLDLDEAIAAGVNITGSAIVIDGLAVALGFGVLVFSLVPANAWLGGLVVLSLLNCLLATLVIMPALLRLLPPKGLRSGSMTIPSTEP